MPILRRVVQILIIITVCVLAYFLTLWVLGMLGIVVPANILTAVFVLLVLLCIAAIITGRLDNITWW